MRNTTGVGSLPTRVKDEQNVKISMQVFIDLLCYEDKARGKRM